MRSIVPEGKALKAPHPLKDRESRKVLDTGFNRTRADRVEKSHDMSVMWRSFYIIVISSAVFFAIGFFLPGEWTLKDFFYNMGCNILAMFIVVLCLDTLVNRNRDSRIRRDEARRILRHQRLISPDIDMYLVRKNMVITPAGKSVKKFQVRSDFTVSDMRDLFSPSELVSDVGISRIRRYAHYQAALRDDFEKLVESVDFMFYPEIADAAMRYLNATSYGQAALDAVVSYEDARAGTKSMRSMVIAMIKEEPEDGRFVDANPTMKNIYLVHQMITEQEKAVADYIALIKVLQEQDPSEYLKKQGGDIERGRPAPCMISPWSRRGRRTPGTGRPRRVRRPPSGHRRTPDPWRDWAGRRWRRPSGPRTPHRPRNLPRRPSPGLSGASSRAPSGRPETSSRHRSPGSPP